MINSTTETETHINDNQAVKKITTTDEEDNAYETKNSYYSYSSYETSPFDNMDLPEQTYTHEPTTITEQEYQSFIENLSNPNDIGQKK